MADGDDYYYVDPIVVHRVTLVRGDGRVVRVETFDRDDAAVRHGEAWVEQSFKRQSPKVVTGQ